MLSGIDARFRSGAAAAPYKTCAMSASAYKGIGETNRRNGRRRTLEFSIPDGKFDAWLFFATKNILYTT
jgi:hypothetical protein